MHKYILLILNSILILNINAASYFIDSFANDQPTDSDSYQQIWNLNTTGNANAVEKDHWLHLNLPGGSEDSKVRLTTAVDRKFNFFAEKEGIKISIRGLFNEGNSPLASRKFAMNITSDAKAFNESENGLRLETDGQGNLKLFLKKDGQDAKTILDRKFTSSVFAFVLYLKPNAYMLRAYYDTKKEVKWGISFNKGKLPFEKPTWGNEGNASIGLEAYNTNITNNNITFKIADFYACSSGLNEDAIKFLPPGVEDTEFFQDSRILNIKSAPYYARGDGTTDDWVAIQKALIDAFEYNCILYFPSGTYSISRSLNCIDKHYLWERGRDDKTPLWQQNYKDQERKIVYRSLDGKRYTIIGAKGKKRPVIKLQDNAPGFEDGKQKPIIQIFAQSGGQKREFAFTDDPKHEQQNICLGNSIKNINIDMGDNKGAVGLRFKGAQANLVEDVKIYGKNGFACFVNLVGHAGGLYNIEGVGCKYGLYVEEQNGGQFPQIAGLKLKDQSVSSIYYVSKSCLTIAGFAISKSQGPAITMQKSMSSSGGNISLVDGSIQFSSPNAGEAINNDNKRIVYLKNVHIQNANKVTKNHQANPEGWTLVKEYAFSYNGRGGKQNSAYSLINGNKQGPEGHEPIANIVTVSDPLKKNLVLKHIWDDRNFPSFDDENVINVARDLKKLGYSKNAIAGGDNETDAIQWAINYASENDKTVFIPPGVFQITHPLYLKKNSRLIGIKKEYMAIKVNEDLWRKEDYGKSMIITPDDKDAEIVIAFLVITQSAKCSVNALNWKAGPKSIVRNCQMNIAKAPEFNPDMQAINISGNGAGRFYANRVRMAKSSGHPNARQFLIKDAKGPLYIYGMMGEGHKSEPMNEIINSENVFIFGYKSEGNSTQIKIQNSRNIFLAGFGGITKPGKQNELFEIIDSENVVFANIDPWQPPKHSPNFTLREKYAGETHSLEFPFMCSYMRRGETPTLLSALDD